MTQPPNISQQFLTLAWKGILEQYKANGDRPYKGMQSDLSGLIHLKVQGHLPDGYLDLPSEYWLLGTPKSFFDTVAPKPYKRLIIHVQVVMDDQNKEQEVTYRCECLNADESGSLTQCKREFPGMGMCPICHRRVCSSHWRDQPDTISMCTDCAGDLDNDERKLILVLREQVDF